MTTIQTINNGETGLQCRNKINSNFTNLNNNKANNTNTINTQTGTSYPPVLADGNGSTIVEMNNANANTFNIPLNSAVAFPVGSVLVVGQIGAGQTTIQAPVGVLLNGVDNGSKAINNQYESASLYQRAIDDWVIVGAIN